MSMVAVMAKKTGPKPKASGVRDALITMRCTPAFKARLESIADSEDRTPSVIIERALRAYAETNKHEPFPDR